eukprot:1168960-Rhodomonas_salina.1
MSGTDLACGATSRLGATRLPFRTLLLARNVWRFASCLRTCYAVSGTCLRACYVLASPRTVHLSGTDKAYGSTLSASPVLIQQPMVLRLFLRSCKY